MQHKSHDIAGNDDESYEYVAEPDPDANSYEEEDYGDEKEDFADKADRTFITEGILMSGSCHLDRVLNVEFGVENRIICFFNYGMKCIFGHLQDIEKVGGFQ